MLTRHDPELDRLLSPNIGDLVYFIGGYPAGIHENAFMDCFEEYDLNKKSYINQLKECLVAVEFNEHFRVVVKEACAMEYIPLFDFLEQRHDIIIEENESDENL